HTPPRRAAPPSHPWILYAEPGPGAAGPDRLRFITRGHPPRLSAQPESDLEVVFYSVHEGEADPGERPALELWRKASPRLPESSGRELADSSTDGALLLADGLAEFGVRFFDEPAHHNPSCHSPPPAPAAHPPP